jgi:uncharacterized YccA/Bax inhibitor family protein
MTVQGTVNKTFILLLLIIASATVTWGMVEDGSLSLWAAVIGGLIGSLVIGLVISFKPRAAPVLAPVYALIEGVFVGAVSLFVADMAGDRLGENSPNTAIVLNAALITFGIAGGLLAAYKAKLIRPNRTFYNATMAATAGLFFYWIIAWIAGMFLGSYSMMSVYSFDNGGMISIGFSLFVILIASANLVMDFDIVAVGAENKAPKYMEWYGAFAIMVSLVWLYIEVLRLLSKLQSRD